MLPRVLVVEDEPPIGGLLRTYLEREGFSVEVVARGQTALDVVGARPPAVILLDVGLPDLEGTEVCRRLRARGDWTPVIFATARDDEVDRVLGLELGADDYVTKPFSPREVVARVRAVLRRVDPAFGVAGHADTARAAGLVGAGSGAGSDTGAGEGEGEGAEAVEVIRVGPVVIDRRTRRVSVAERDVVLTTTEFDLLAHLAAASGRVFSREALLTDVWGYPPGGPVTRTVDVHVAQLRAKLGGAVTFRSVRGIGYAVEP